MELPKISIITPSFNQGQFLEQTLRSVLDQNYPQLEYIVIDGGSTDESVNIIKRYEPRLTYWVSEPDRGQAHAINKGLEKASGEVVAFINSDDVYLPGAFMAVVEYFRKNTTCKWLCGDTLLFGEEGHPTKLIQAVVPKSVFHCLRVAYLAPQPGMFWKRELLCSGFQEHWRYCFDHELYVRLLLQGYKCAHLPLPIAAYRYHPDSKSVAELNRFAGEFNQVAELYENQLKGTARRWCRATRFLQQSYKASEAGNVQEATVYLLRALLTHPEGIPRRLFRKCFNQILKGVLVTINN